MEAVAVTAAVERQRVKGFEAMLTVADMALLLRKPTRYVTRLIKSGALRGVKLGGNSYRVRPQEWEAFVARSLAAGGVAGHRHARPSGGVRHGMQGFRGAAE
jgi:excisionase family DNA binding protein